MSSFQPPYYVGGNAAGWALADYLQLAATSPKAAGGVATIELRQLSDDERWLIDHAVVACTSTTPTQLTWYTSTAATINLLDGSESGNFDVGEWPNGLQTSPGNHLYAQWTGCSDGAVATLTLQGRVLRRTG